MHAPLTREPFSGALIFNTAADMLTAMFGPSDHDWHVRRYRVWLKDMARTYGLPEWERAQILAAVRSAKEAA